MTDALANVGLVLLICQSRVIAVNGMEGERAYLTMVDVTFQHVKVILLTFRKKFNDGYLVAIMVKDNK